MPRSAKNPLLKKSATQNERDFRVDFYAEDAIRLSPYKDDKWKYAENTPFWAGSDYSRLPSVTGLEPDAVLLGNKSPCEATTDKSIFRLMELMGLRGSCRFIWAAK